MLPGYELEKHVQSVYSYLLNMKDEGIVVGQDVQIVDKFGSSHQVDVYYQFEKAGIVHKVAIECKNHGRPIDNGQVAKFIGKLQFAGNIQKIMISRLGYQKLAIEMAKNSDVILLTKDELPRIIELLAERIKTVALPDENAIGEPFWIIMEKSTSKDVSVTGSFFSTSYTPSGKKVIPMFFSKKSASIAFQQGNLDYKKWCVRGMPKYVFRAFLIQLDLFEIQKMAGAALMHFDRNVNRFIAIPISRKQLMDEYYDGEIPSLGEKSMK